MNRLKSGLWPVMLTPFDEDSRIDWDSLQRLVDWYIDNGAAGLFACCLSSEMFELSDEERLQLAGQVVRFVKQRCQVVATGTFSHGIPGSIEMIKRMADTGVDAVVINTAFLTAENQDDSEVTRHLDQVIRETDPIPLGLYECPFPYKRLITLHQLSQIRDTERFLYMKDTCCDLETMEKRAKIAANSLLKLFNANTPTLLKSLRSGMDGVSCIAANIYPGHFARLFEQFREDPDSCDGLHNQLARIDPAVRINYPLNAKILLKEKGIFNSTHCRVPTLPLTDDHRELGRILSAFAT